MRPGCLLALGLVLTLSPAGFAEEPQPVKATQALHQVTLHVTGMT